MGLVAHVPRKTGLVAHAPHVEGPSVWALWHTWPERGDHANPAHVGRQLTITAALTLERGPRLTLPVT
jgi:hypothetical protein